MARDREEYNGWANYATWRIHLEVFDGYEPDAPVSADECREQVEELIEASSDEGLARDYALAFINDVDWREIAEQVNEGIDDDDDAEA